MIGSRFKSLKAKLVFAFVLVALVPVAIVGYLAFSNAGSALRKAELDRLHAAQELRIRLIHRYFRETMQMVKFLAETGPVKTAAEALVSGPGSGKEPSEASTDVRSDQYKKMYDSALPFFKNFLDNHPSKDTGCEDILIVGAEQGSVVFTVQKRQDLGSNLRKGDLRDSGLAKLWRQVVETRKPALVDFQPYRPIAPEAAFIGAPVFGDQGKLVGVLAFRLSGHALQEIIRQETGDAAASKIFLVGQDFRVLASSEGASDEGGGRRIETDYVRKALEDASGVESVMDAQGQRILRSYSHAGLNEQPGLGARFEWAVVAQIAESEAFAPVRTLRRTILLAALLIGAAVAAFALLPAGAISNPIAALAAQAKQVSDGDLTVNVAEVKRSDEVSDLSRSFRIMVDNLRTQTAQVLEGVNILAASAGEISVTTAQLAATASKTSAAVTETAATAEQLKQAARLSKEKAQHVSESSRQVAQVSDSGKQATAATVEKMLAIKGHMRTVGDTVLGLSENSQAIEEIISAVNDLAEQSNLLAVNAAIEAARAGEHGKGFSVVAQEIKVLADQSKDATAQIRSILDEVRRSISAVVMATEQGTKAVDAGVEQSVQAGKSIESLATSVTEATKAAGVIVGSSEQQFVGVGQVASAMANVEFALKQNVEGTSQLETEAARLKELGFALKELVGRYKV